MFDQLCKLYNYMDFKGCMFPLFIHYFNFNNSTIYPLLIFKYELSEYLNQRLMYSRLYNPPKFPDVCSHSARNFFFSIVTKSSTLFVSLFCLHLFHFSVNYFRALILTILPTIFLNYAFDFLS